MGKSFRMPNSFGSVYRLSGNRRRPWAIAKTFGWDKKGKQIQKIIGYAETKKDAMQILLEYNNNPLSNHELLNLTVEQAFEKWLLMIEKEQCMSNSNLAAYKSVFKNHCKKIHKIKIIELRTTNVQECIDNCSLGYNTKKYIVLIASQLYKYCNIQLDMNMPKNFSEGLKTGNKSKSDLHIPFTNSEIQKLWDNLSLQWVDTILLSIYTGLRPSELLKIELNNVFLEKRYMIGGIKTKAGINRTIPIHEDIVKIIEKLLNKNNKYLIEKDNKKVNYRYYLTIYKDTLTQLDMSHTPHDGRHTLATELDNINANEVCTKLIMGHAINDITKGVYTHKELQQLIDTINSVKFC